MNRRSDRGPSLGSRWFCAAHLPERENRPTPPASVSFPRGRRRIERPVRRQDRPLPLCTSSSSMIPSLLSVGKSVFRARPEHAFSYAAAVTRPGCPSNTENRHAVSRILAGTKQHIPGSSCNILPGSAPALHSVILYPFSPLPLPLAHPITLTPNPGAEPSPRPGCVSICAKTGANTAVSRTFCGETDGAPRNRIPASETRSGGRDRVWDAGRGHQPWA